MKTVQKLTPKKANTDNQIRSTALERSVILNTTRVLNRFNRRPISFSASEVAQNISFGPHGETLTSQGIITVKLVCFGPARKPEERFSGNEAHFI